MKRPFYLSPAKCRPGTWLLFRRTICGRTVWRICGWDFY